MEAEHVWLACEIKHGATVTLIRNEIEKFKLTDTIADCASQCLSQYHSLKYQMGLPMAMTLASYQQLLTLVNQGWVMGSN